MRNNFPNGSTSRKVAPGAAARNVLLINLFVTPGMGSLMGGRILEGLGQIVVAVAGFALVMTWFVSVMIQYYGMINDQETSFQSRAWLGIAGLITFGVAWLWALVTSMNLVREARRKELAQRHLELQRPVEDKSN